MLGKNLLEYDYVMKDIAKHTQPEITVVRRVPMSNALQEMIRVSVVLTLLVVGFLCLGIWKTFIMPPLSSVFTDTANSLEMLSLVLMFVGGLLVLIMILTVAVIWLSLKAIKQQRINRGVQDALSSKMKIALEGLGELEKKIEAPNHHQI